MTKLKNSHWSFAQPDENLCPSKRVSLIFFRYVSIGLSALPSPKSIITLDFSLFGNVYLCSPTLSVAVNSTSIPYLSK